MPVADRQAQRRRRASGLVWERLHDAITSHQARTPSPALLLIETANLPELILVFGYAYVKQALASMLVRLGNLQRADGDHLIELDLGTYALCFEARENGAARAVELFRRPIMLDGNALYVDCCAGYVRHGARDCARAVASKAMAALARARSRGPGQLETVDVGFDTHSRARCMQVQKLREILHDETLTLAFQPQVDLATGKVLAVEALARWPRAQGEVSPATFIALAEEAGLIETLGMQVLRQAANACRDLRRMGFPVRVAVNASPRELESQDYPIRLAALARENQITPGEIEIEITESVDFWRDDTATTLNRIRAMGYSIALDDFGSGYSLLSRISRFPIDRIKIDRSLIRELSCPAHEHLVAGLIAMAKLKSVRILAEGVQTEAQAERLRQLGCHEAQGFLFAQPMTFAELRTWLPARVPSPIRSGCAGRSACTP